MVRLADSFARLEERSDEQVGTLKMLVGLAPGLIPSRAQASSVTPAACLVTNLCYSMYTS